MSEKPKSIRAIRRLRKRQPKLVEGPKHTLFIRGNKSSESTMKIVKDLRSLRKQHSVMYSRKHDTHPFQSRQEIERMCKKADASLFMFCSHSKKRPNNLIVGRTYEHKVLDMVELGVVSSNSIEEVAESIEVPFNAHPFVVFQGDLWESDEDFKKLKNLLNDFFLMNNRPKGLQIDKAMNVVVSWSVTEEKRIFLNVFQVEVEGGLAVLEEEGKLVIQELGPNAVFVLRRNSWAAEQQFKKAMYIPKPKKKKQNKNVRYDNIGNKRGKLYLDRQNLKSLPSKRRKLISKGERREGGEIVGHSKNEDEFAQ